MKKFKKIRMAIFLLVAALAATGTLFMACENLEGKPEAIILENILLQPSSLSLTVGDSKTILTTFLPGNATDKTVIWESSNTNVATVSLSGGVVTAIAPGTATIYANGTNSIHARCEVTVTPAPVAVESVSVSPTTLGLTVGESKTLTETVLPENATNKTVTWSSSSTAIATVENGTVTGLAPGIATITATTVDGNKNATCLVAITAATVAVESVTVTPATLSLTVGGSQTLTATVLPENATNKAVTWSSNNLIATVTNDGAVKGVAAGLATITVTTADGGYTATCAVTVTAKVGVTSVSVSSTTLSVLVDSSKTLTATVSPSNAANKAVTWSSSAPTIATVSSTGAVTGVAPGTANITVTTVDGAKTATCYVAVIPAVLVEHVMITNSMIDLHAIGEKATINLSIMPENATNKTMLYATETPGVATIDANGVVTAIGAGSTKFTVTTTDGSTDSEGNPKSDFGFIYVTL
jgi:uncharacterized protein YjdB